MKLRGAQRPDQRRFATPSPSLHRAFHHYHHSRMPMRGTSVPKSIDTQSRCDLARNEPRLATWAQRFAAEPLIDSVTQERVRRKCSPPSSSTLLFFRPPALSSGWGIMRSSASLPYTPWGAMCKNVCHLRWRQGSGRRASSRTAASGQSM